jgi:ABC-2 type transport system ATP-binding protein
LDISVENIYKSFGAKEVLRGISFGAGNGTAFGLLGRNGAGKTTTIRIIMGVFPADSGSVLVDGSGIHRENLRIGYLPEERGLYAKSQITEQLVYLARLRGMDRAAARKSIKYWLERLGMEEFANKKLDVLSKGNQQKIQLAAALIADPEMIILDEPFSGLDPVNATLLKDVVKEQIAKGKLVIFSSHQMNYVEEFCDSIAILHNGEIVLDGGIEDIKRSYDRRIMQVRSREAKQVMEFCSGLTDIVKSAEEVRGGVKVKLHSEPQKNDLLLALAEKRFDIDGIEVFEPSLNDIFVEYTGDSEKEGGQEDEAV